MRNYRLIEKTLGATGNLPNSRVVVLQLIRTMLWGLCLFGRRFKLSALGIVCMMQEDSALVNWLNYDDARTCLTYHSISRGHYL